MNILVINGHPDSSSFCHALATQYKLGCEKAGNRCELVHLTDLAFNPVLKYGFNIKMELEPDLVRMQHLIREANHLVFIFPIWWGTYPAIVKGFIDRVFLPGFAFKEEAGLGYEKKLTGKSATVITTMNTPWWHFRLLYKRPAYHLMKQFLFRVCGISCTKYIAFTPIKNSTPKQRALWMGRIYKMGIRMKPHGTSTERATADS